MAHLAWNDEYLVGINVLDDQHIELFEIVNRLHEAMMSGQEPAVTGPLMATLIAATRRHFETEEKILADLGYPGLESHRELHRELVRRAQSYCVRYRCEEKPLSPHLLNFLRDWLANHIWSCDQEYAVWLKHQPDVDPRALKGDSQ